MHDEKLLTPPEMPKATPEASEEITDYLWSVIVIEYDAGRTPIAAFKYFEDAALFLGQYLIQHECADGGSIEKIKENWG